MTPFPRALRVTCLCLAGFLPVAAFAGFADFIFPKRDLEVITVTDTTPAGALRRPPTAENPIYYIAVDSGHRDFGGIIAGDKIPPNSEVNRTMAKVLAKQHFLPATKVHPPTIVLIWSWGTMNVDRAMTMDGSEGPQLNRNQLLRFLGGYKLGMVAKDPHDYYSQPLYPELRLMDADANMLSDVATEDLYVIALGAYDLAALQRKEKVMLWSTKISCPSIGFVLKDTLPTMLAIAGPNIGRETVRPVWVKATDRYKPEVKVGEMVVVPDTEPLPILDASKAKFEKANPGPKPKRNR